MDNKGKAIFFMLLSALAYAFMNAFVKLAGGIPIFQRVLITNVVMLIMTWFVIYKNKLSYFGKREHQKYLFARSFWGYIAVVTNFYAIAHLTIADSSILGRLSPFIVTICAYFYLKEKISKIQIPALIIVFIGTLLVVRPSFNLEIVPALSGIISAIFSGFAYTLLRVLGDKEDSNTTVFYFAVVSVIFSIPFAITNYIAPNPYQWLMLILIGVSYGIAQITMTLSYKYAPASEVSIYIYSNIIFAIGVGYIFFREIPDMLSVLGSIFIIAASIMVYLDSKKNSKNEDSCKEEKINIEDI